MNVISITVDGNEFWQKLEDDTEQIPDFNALDNLANGFKWTMTVKGSRQRKPRCRSVMTHSIYAMLENVKYELKQDAGAIVHVLVPDVCIEFTA